MHLQVDDTTQSIVRVQERRFQLGECLVLLVRFVDQWVVAARDKIEVNLQPGPHLSREFSGAEEEEEQGGSGASRTVLDAQESATRQRSRAPFL